MSKLNKKVIDDLLKDCKTPEDFFREKGLIKRFVKSVMESTLNAELTTDYSSGYPHVHQGVHTHS
jgi:hypothetical protein